MTQAAAKASDPNEAKIAELRAAHGELVTAVTGKRSGRQLIAFRVPSLEEWEDYQAKARNQPAVFGAAVRELAQRTVVYPSLEELKEIFQKEPGITGPLSFALSELAGSEIEITIKKD